jgi:hypothetical protein
VLLSRGEQAALSNPRVDKTRQQSDGGCMTRELTTDRLPSQASTATLGVAVRAFRLREEML